MKYRRILKSRLEQVTSLNRLIYVVLACINCQPIQIYFHASDPCYDVCIGRQPIQLLNLWIPNNTLRPFLFGPPTLICSRCIQMYTTYKGFGAIRKKPQIYALLLKRKSGPGDRSMEAVMECMPDMEEKIIEDGKEIPWYQGKNIYQYIIGRQHTVESFCKIASREPFGFVQREELLKFKIILDPAMLTRVSTALNLNITNRVVKEVYHQNVELGRAK